MHGANMKIINIDINILIISKYKILQKFIR